MIMSGVGTAFQSLIQGLSRKARQHDMSYCARTYYSSIGTHSWEVHFVIMWNLELHISVSYILTNQA